MDAEAHGSALGAFTAPEGGTLAKFWQVDPPWPASTRKRSLIAMGKRWYFSAHLGRGGGEEGGGGGAVSSMGAAPSPEGLPLEIFFIPPPISSAPQSDESVCNGDVVPTTLEGLGGGGVGRVGHGVIYDPR